METNKVFENDVNRRDNSPNIPEPSVPISKSVKFASFFSFERSGVRSVCFLKLHARCVWDNCVYNIFRMLKMGVIIKWYTIVKKSVVTCLERWGIFLTPFLVWKLCWKLWCQSFEGFLLRCKEGSFILALDLISIPIVLQVVASVSFSSTIPNRLWQKDPEIEGLFDDLFWVLRVCLWCGSSCEIWSWGLKVPSWILKIRLWCWEFLWTQIKYES